MARGRYTIGFVTSDKKQIHINARRKKEYNLIKKKMEDSFDEAIKTAESQGVPIALKFLRRFVFNVISIDAQWPELTTYAKRILSVAIPKEDAFRGSKVYNQERIALANRIRRFIADNP